MCLKESSLIDTHIYSAVTAICKEMGYKFAHQWIYDEDYKWELNFSGYAPELYDVYCRTVNWEECTSKKPNIVQRHCYPQEYLMLSCSGLFVTLISQ